ncbi:MAG: DUF2092 domain-containing protein [Desulfosarcina sp.]|nr:DUF2092 domain-containing protein [Desulfosarcina sp.]MBC2767736.1 DUF2092 domain-containing protein [Desulfosarcina sp.]
MRKTSKKRMPLLTVMALVVIGISTLPGISPATESSIDPRADQILRKMSDHLGSLQQFSVHTQNTLEDMLYWGYRVDYDVAAKVVVSRPNKLRAERRGDLIDQSFFYDGKTLTLYNPSDKVYATEPAPGTIEEMFNFTRESLGLIIPVADLVYRNAYPLLMQDGTLAVVIGKSVVGGVKCDHLLFSRPGVDFQVWIADSGPPLPYKYVVTDTGTPARLSISTVMSAWNTAPSVVDNRFSFVPPKEAKLISFMPF